MKSEYKIRKQLRYTVWLSVSSPGSCLNKTPCCIDSSFRWSNEKNEYSNGPQTTKIVTSLLLKQSQYSHSLRGKINYYIFVYFINSPNFSINIYHSYSINVEEFRSSVLFRSSYDSCILIFHSYHNHPDSGSSYLLYFNRISSTDFNRSFLQLHSIITPTKQRE